MIDILKVAVNGSWITFLGFWRADSTLTFIGDLIGSKALKSRAIGLKHNGINHVGCARECVTQNHVVIVGLGPPATNNNRNILTTAKKISSL